MSSAPAGDAHPRRNGPRRTSRYGPYTGGPDPLAPPVDLAEALAAIGRDVMSGTSPQRAMQEYLRTGGRQLRGLDDIGRQVAQRRRELLNRNRLGGTLDEIRELLDRAVLSERQQLARDLDEDARFAEMRLEGLPASTAASVSELADYSWRSASAREDFERIKDLLGRELLDQRFAGMKQALQNATEQDRRQINQMLEDLNELLEAHQRGEDTDEAFAQFMNQHGDFFPEQPQNVEELIDALAARAAAGQRMLNSMSAEQRAELLQLADQAFGSPQLSASLARLDATLQGLRPGEDWTGRQRFGGEQGVGLGDGTGMLQDVAELDALAEQLAQQYPGADLSDVDVDALARQLGPQAAADARTLAEVERALRDSGYLRRAPDGSLRLSPKAMRQLGKELLKDVATRMSGRVGQRDAHRAGGVGEPTGASRPWEFGSTEPWDVTRSTLNAIGRQAATGGGSRGGPAGPRIRLEIGDVETVETELRTQAAVALLVDTSFSMAVEGRWVPMKRTALALHQLVTTRFRGDRLQLIGFGREAQVFDIEELTGLDTIWRQGTNLHHGLLLANRHFRRNPTAQPVLLVVTDGEPTAHLEPDGQSYFDYPPDPRTLALTVQELDTAGRLGAQVTFFRLGDEPRLVRFTDKLAGRVGGRVTAPDVEGLDAAVVGSYLGTRFGRRWGFAPDDWD